MATRGDLDGWMWAEAVQLLGEAERLHRHFFRPAASERAAPAWEPPADVFENEREMVIVIAMPGVASEQVQVGHEAGALVVRAARPLPLRDSGLRVRQLEIPYGSFERRIRLPPGRLEIGAPELAQGCLLIHVRKLGRDAP
jgi:HSP20 family molecular chaperone IbpA